MNKVMDKHRKVKVDYSLLAKLLSYITDNDGFANFDVVSGEWRCEGFPADIKNKAIHLIENS